MCLIILLLVNVLFSKNLTPLSNCQKARISHFSGWENGGACQFGPVNTTIVAGYMFGASPNEAFFMNTQQCGICYDVVGPSGSMRVLVTNFCPIKDAPCRGDMIHFDLNDNGYANIADYDLGSNNVSIKMVPCDHNSNIQVNIIDGSNAYYIGFVILKHIIGINGVQISQDNYTWIKLARNSNNRWIYDPDKPLIIPYYLQVTAISGESVNIKMTSTTAFDTITSDVQFKVPDDLFFEMETLKIAQKPVNMEECCELPDDWTDVYEDSQKGVWIGMSIRSTTDFGSVESPYKGTKCIKQEMGDYAGLHFYTNTPPKSGMYTGFYVYVKVTEECNSCLLFKAKNPQNNGIKKSVVVGEWTKIEVTFDEIGADITNFLGFTITNEQKDVRTVYFDEIHLIKSIDPPSTRKCTEEFRPQNGVLNTPLLLLSSFIFIII
ncbi:hypothetical protein EIN_184760 [Entamoeba invadens IP1]|uniref:hypothetical protein n=1 Tax=Entamoeba invadens IP1 TaxID=370355 RepID=UPI0002C3ED12|nr:hypothetical protein EIN_184760 [Entamoeba invadens IP1]ELP94109.1 hypothetical protein EIN_184760 [Entamoeba invadens IP1]|eukprot:XP_004260880.1 hypothetical protein EIN_184760 [Entamoeba invadens IP1]